MADLEHLNRKIEDLLTQLDIDALQSDVPGEHDAIHSAGSTPSKDGQLNPLEKHAIEKAGDTTLSFRAKPPLRFQPNRAVKFSLVKRLLPKLEQTHTLKNKLNLILSELGAALLIQKGFVVLFNLSSNDQTVVGEYDLSPNHTSGVGIRFPMNWITDLLLETGKTLLIQEGHCTHQTQPVYKLMKYQGIQSRAIFPVYIQGEIIGAMSLDLSETGRQFSTEDIQLVEFVLSKTL